MSDINEMEKRLKAIEQQGPQKSGGAKVGVIGAGVAILAAGGAYLLASSAQNSESATLHTSTVESFQAPQSNAPRLQFETPELNQRIEAATIQIDEALQPSATITTSNPELESELAALKEQIAQNNRDRDASIAAAVNDLKGAFEDQQAQLKKDVDAAKLDFDLLKASSDAEKQGLQAQLDAAVMEQEATAFNNIEQQRLAFEQKQKAQDQLDAQALEEKRVTSPSLVFSTSRGVAESSSNDGASTSKNASYVPSNDEKFLRSNPALVVTQAEQMQSPDDTLAQGSVVQAVLQTAINSDLAGNVVAVVSEPVLGFTGERVLVPQGSRLFGAYRSGVQTHQKRILIAWSRILTPDGKSIEIASVGGDTLGRSGLTGFVDTKFGERFGGAALISVIGAGPAIAANQISSEVRSDTFESLADDFQDATSGVIADQISIAPTIYVDQGASVTVLVDRDVVIYQ